jgi:hypothetical protein
MIIIRTLITQNHPLLPRTRHFLALLPPFSPPAPLYPRRGITIPANFATPTTPSQFSSTCSPLSPLDIGAPDNLALPSSPFSPLNPLSPDPQALSPSTSPTNSGLETTVGLKGNTVIFSPKSVSSVISASEILIVRILLP